MNKKLEELVNESNLVPRFKLQYLGFIANAREVFQKEKEIRDLIEQVANVKRLSEVILSTDEVIIYTVNGKDEWDIKYPFRSIYKNKDGKWIRVDTVSPTFDTAFVYYLEYKYLGLNSRFTDFALKMLEIELK